MRNRSDPFLAWASDEFSSARGLQILDRQDAVRIAWDEDAEASPAPHTRDQ